MRAARNGRRRGRLISCLAAGGGKDEATKCMKSEGDCDSESCSEHGDAVKKRNAKEKSKTAAAGAGGEEALKRADIEAMMDTKLAAQFQPVNESLKMMADVLKAIAAAPATSNVRRGAVGVVTKANDGSEDATKTVDALVKDGKSVEALMLLRQRPQFVTTGANGNE